MFAPDDVFKTEPLPHGHYWPSPMNNQQGIVLKTQKVACNREKTTSRKNTEANSQLLRDRLKDNEKHPKIIHSCKENVKPNINVEVVNTDTASTSVDDLISDIDKNLAIDPNTIKPKADNKVSIDNILSVSNHSDTSTHALSPSALKYYMERFKHSDPSHPSERSSGEQTLSFKSNKVKELEKCVNDISSNDSSYDTITLNSSSYLERIVSSDDSTEWCFTNEFEKGDAFIRNGNCSKPILSDCENTVSAQSVNVFPAEQKPMSFIEQLTGKTFSELSQIVPKEVICPADENEDILYQWRLKRHMNEAKNSVPVDDTCTEATKTTIFQNQSSSSDVEHSFKSPILHCVSKEIQTDVEKRESGCQVMVVDDHSGKDSAPPKDDPKPKALNTAHLFISDSCSDISISSVSTDDLTTISDLEEDHNDDVIDKQFRSRDLAEPGNSATDKQVQFVCSDKPCKQNVPNPLAPQEMLPNVTINQKYSNENQSVSHGKMQEQQAENDVSVSQINVDELLSYLENIRSNFDDELLNIFIDRYQTVLTQMSEIEDEIKKHCNED